MVVKEWLFMFLAMVFEKVFSKEKIYMGEEFPAKYMIPDDVAPTSEDLNYYLVNLLKVVDYFANSPNETEVNSALGSFYLKSLFKRSLIDDGHKYNDQQREAVVHAVRGAEYILDHYIYDHGVDGWNDPQYRVTRLFEDDAPQVHTLNDFNRHRLGRWIVGREGVNQFVQGMDNATLPKEKYVSLIESPPYHEYHIKIPLSDFCVTRVVYNPEPIDLTKMRPCRKDMVCKRNIFSWPSIGYYLSHRFFNNQMYYQVRRCYFHSEEIDLLHMEMLCAEMYREAVYLARRGFFVRDLFLEHLALCGIMGHEEFFRKHWFYKAISWMDEDGCVMENRNYELNRSAMLMQRYQGDSVKLKTLRQMRKQLLHQFCHGHAMALLLIVLAHAVRHAVHFMVVGLV